MTLAPLPNSDNWYACVVNATPAVEGYEPTYLPAQTQLITDLTDFGSPPAPGTEMGWRCALAALRGRLASPLIGTYRSMRSAAPAPTRAMTFPPRWNTLEAFTSADLLLGIEDSYQAQCPGLTMVDYSQSAAAAKLTADLVAGVAATGAALAFLDEVSSDELDPRLPPWSVTMGVLKSMTAGLHARGVRVLINAAIHFGTTTPANVAALLASGVDGVCLEEGFPAPSVRQSASAIQTAIAQFRQLLDAGLCVVFDPNSPNYAADAAVLAAWGMMLRAPGDRLFISVPFYLTSIPAWATWPKTLGAPSGPASVATDGTGQIVLSRSFAGGTVALNTFTGNVGVG